MSETTATTERVLTIQRSKWRRGGEDAGQSRPTHGPTRLLNRNGLMCCLGFDALACGLQPADILDHGDPVDLFDNDVLVGHAAYQHSRLVDESGNGWLSARVNDLVNRAISHNDDPDLEDFKRERLIAEDLTALGWDRVEFVD